MKDSNSHRIRSHTIIAEVEVPESGVEGAMVSMQIKKYAFIGE